MNYPAKIGSVTVYRLKHKQRGTVYLLRWRDYDGTKQQKMFSAAGEAADEAKRLSDLHAKGLKTTDALAPSDAQIYAHCVARIQRTGKTLLQVVDEFVRQWSPEKVDMSFKEVFESYTLSIETKSKHHKKDVRFRGGVLVKRYGTQQIDAITSADILQFLRKRAKKPRTFNNWLLMAKTIFNHGITIKALYKSPLENNAPLVVRPNKKVLMNYLDLDNLLKEISQHRHCAELYPYLAILAFGGIRTEEAKFLQWEDIKRENGVPSTIFVHAGKIDSRSVDVHFTLRNHLKHYIKENGPIVKHYQDPDKEIRKRAKKIGIKWLQNMLRHTYATHFLKLWKRPDYCAYQMGTSIKMFKKTYEGLSDSNQAHAWFTMCFPYLEGKMQKIDMAIPTEQVHAAKVITGNL